ncbi:hypothetical protein MVEN_00075700 [Mycena venus]|uniref:DUF6534 domain-containing protein n=1 Tax=Mycena venus TaxID=2733690 RepID=A0A8H6Z8A4_9AGAR|nr:hypothetical protein MVEN_00075700 [Mycena venus]
MPGQLDSTYGAWFVALFIENLLYGMGLVQTWIYLFRRPADKPCIKWTVLIVLALETLQMLSFFRSSYFRFVERFGQIQIDPIWTDSLQLLAGYLNMFAVQLYFASRIHASGLSLIGVWIILILAVVQISAGIAQTVVLYCLGSYTRLSETTPVTAVQSAACLACDLLTMAFLCLFFRRSKGNSDMKQTRLILDRLISDAINRGTLTSLSSAMNLILFLALPNTFWFFLGLAPSSKLYMITFLTSYVFESSLPVNASPFAQA